MRRLKLPGSFVTALLGAALGIGLLLIPTPAHIAQFIGTVVILLSVLAAAVGLREARRGEQAQQQKTLHVWSRTYKGGLYDNLYRKSPEPPVG